MGLFGFIFSNFGKNHPVIDKDGKEPKRFIITNITNEENCLVTIGDNKNFDLENESEVILKNIKGMDELNNRVFLTTKKRKGGGNEGTDGGGGSPGGGVA